MVEWRYDLVDIEEYRQKAFSSLHLIPKEAFDRGISLMEKDLKKGPIPFVCRSLLLWGMK
jgi:hypothetical protein